VRRVTCPGNYFRIGKNNRSNLFGP
jgi:hypothetical protein